MKTVFLSLGSNLGDRLALLGGGIRALAAGGLLVEAASSVVETPPVGFAEQPPYLNLVVRGSWGGEVEDLMDLLSAVEGRAGRLRSFPNAPRTLDVDLVFFGDRIIRSFGVRIPHPRWKGRIFVVRPLQEVGGWMVDPETGLTVDEIGRKWPQHPADIAVVEGGDFFGSRRVLKKWGAAAHRGFASARQGRTTNAMRKHRGGVLTPYGAATPLCPSGFACAMLGGLAEAQREPATRQATRLGGTGPSAALGLLDVAHGYVCACASLSGLAEWLTVSTSLMAARLGAPSCTWPRGARAERSETTECSQVKPARPTSSTPF